MSSPTAPLPPLGDDQPARDPLVQFTRWMDEAEASGVHEPIAMALATAAPDGAPSARMVLLRDFGPDGFVWYTNYESRKGAELAANPTAALLFHWAAVGRQIRIEGTVARVPEGVSDAYFATRERLSQIGAWASQQSRPLPDRAALEARVEEVSARFAGRTVPRPVGWGGYVLTPTAFEFWQHRENRLHDRFTYTRDGTGWRLSRLAP